jgi:NADH-quinone oxidoreductase subunit F
MALTPRVLPPRPMLWLADYERAGGGQGLEAAARLGPDGVIDEIAASGLRGRGGAGFPTGRKWAAVSGNVSPVEPTTVVVNGAEGEPGSFKDRAIMRADPYRVLEGALIAAFALTADTVIVAVKETFTAEAERLRAAIQEIHAAGWATDVELSVFEGPPEYLYGEETGLLEVIDGRHPFPRVAPPYRHGVDEVGPEETDAPPTLVNNAETMANVPGIMANGPRWYRELGTDESPGTIVCTVSGHVDHAGVAEMPMGTPLGQIIDEVSGGARPGRRLVAAMSGVANALVTAEHFDTPASHEAMRAIGSGLGAAGFIVFDDATDFAEVAYGVSRFLAVESCGQCTPCKEDGLALASIFDRVRRSEATDLDLLAIDDHLRTVTDGARCFLATQQQQVIASIMELEGDHLGARARGESDPAEPILIGPLADIRDGEAVIDEHQLAKQPDWSFDAVDSGQSPAARFHEPHPNAGLSTLHPAPAAAAPAGSPAGAREPASARRLHEATAVPEAQLHGDREERLYASAPIDTDDGPVVVIHEQDLPEEGEPAPGS